MTEPNLWQWYKILAMSLAKESQSLFMICSPKDLPSLIHNMVFHTSHICCYQPPLSTVCKYVSRTMLMFCKTCWICRIDFVSWPSFVQCISWIVTSLCSYNSSSYDISHCNHSYIFCYLCETFKLFANNITLKVIKSEAEHNRGARHMLNNLNVKMECWAISEM